MSTSLCMDSCRSLWCLFDVRSVHLDCNGVKRMLVWMYAQFFGTYEFTLNHKINVFGLLVTNAKIHCNCAPIVALLTLKFASSRSCELHKNHRPFPYTFKKANWNRTTECRQWEWTCELFSSSPPRLWWSSRPWQRFSRVHKIELISWQLVVFVHQPFWVLIGRPL